MTMHGETIATETDPRCEDCGVMPPLDVHESRAGFYIGSYCACGPYSRESRYYPTRDEAIDAFEATQPKRP